MTISVSRSKEKSAKSLCNCASQHEKTTVMRGGCRSLYAPASEQQFSLQVISPLQVEKKMFLW